MKPGLATLLRVVTVLLCAAGGILLLLCWGLGMKFWSIIGIIAVLMSFAAAYFIAARDYPAGATPAGLAAVVVIFMLLPPAGMSLVAVIMLLAATGLAYLLYEVD